MNNKRLIPLFLGLFLAGVTAAPVFADDKDQVQERKEVQERAYGWELMSDAERAEYRERMRLMKTEEEREAFRREHHEQMEKRAKERGVTLPEAPMMRPGTGPGPGPGMRPGAGMGPGTGMGPGPNR